MFLEKHLLVDVLVEQPGPGAEDGLGLGARGRAHRYFFLEQGVYKINIVMIQSRNREYNVA